MKLQLNPTSVLPLLMITSLVGGCASTVEPDEDSAGDMTASGDGDGDGSMVSEPGGDGDAAPGDGDAIDMGTGGTVGDGDGDGDGTPGDGDAVDPGPLPIDVYLPVTVTDVFAPSGFMGAEFDAAEEGEVLDIITMDELGCAPEDRPEGAVGECFAVTYAPSELIPCNAAQLEADPTCEGASWAGAFFQNPSGNWGEAPGTVVEQGATKVLFTAWSAEGDLDMTFFAGGIGNLGSEYADTFKVESAMTITDTPTQYELNLTGASYEMVLGGFGWSIEVQSSDEVVFYLDDIKWVTE